MKTRKGDFNNDGTRAVAPVAVEAPVSEADNDPDNDYLALTVAELRVRADIQGIEISRKATKSDIIAALEDDGGNGFTFPTTGYTSESNT